MNNQEKTSKLIECPICSKEFSTASIENHVTKCLFLNESTNETETSLKRTFVSKGDNSTSKKSKQNENCNFKKCNESFKSKHELLDLHDVTDSQNTQISTISTNTNSSDSDIKQKKSEFIPLAEKMRPNSIISYIGQNHIIGAESILYKLLIKTEIPNIILWGPPGCGKTSLANVIANLCKQCPKKKYHFVKLSAAMSGVNDVKEAITIASNDLKFGRRTVIFMDEIHRFNKIQQDIFLPHIESGTITLIGATTENPSFTLNSALLSRCRVMILEKLSTENLITILEHAVDASQGLICDTEEYSSQSKISSLSNNFIIDKSTIRWLAETSDGDARIALGGLELAMQSKISNKLEHSNENLNSISLNDVKESLQKTHMLYDKKGDQHYDMVSALHKSVRASDENASLYWLTRMLMGGEDPMYIARRLVRMASEDIGLADPKALGLAVHTMHACKMLGMPECDVLLAQCTTYLAKAPKSRLMEDALRAAQQLVSNYKGSQPSVPLHLRNAPTKLMKNIGCGEGYNMLDKNISGLTYLPEDFKDVDFFCKK